MMRFCGALFVVLSLLVSSVEAANFRHSTPSYPTYTAIVNATTAVPGITVPAGYIGFSVEAQDLISGYFQGSSGTWNSVASATSYIGLAGLLGTAGNFRVGGSSCSTSTTPALTQAIATNLATFLAALGANWKLNYCLDLFANNAALAATQAGYMVTAFGASNVIFQLNNEPLSSGQFTLSSYQTAFNSYYSTIIGSQASAGFSTWNDYSVGLAQTLIPGLTPGVSGLKGITYHYYNLNGQLTTPTNFLNFVGNSPPWSQNTIWAGSTPQLVNETNSVNIGGVHGLSDGLIAATWFINQTATLVPLGYSGVNVHMTFGGETAGKPQGYYNPLVLQADQNFAPGAIFYALYMVTKLQGQQLLPLSISDSGVIGLASLGTGGNANILLANNSLSAYASVTVGQDAAWTTAKQLILSGTSCYDTAPKLGGQSIGESGSWGGTQAVINKGQPTIIPPCGLALVSIQP